MKTRWAGVAAGLALLAAGPAWALNPPGGTACTKQAVIDATNATAAWGVVQEITAQPARVCSVSFIASYAANGWAQVFDSPATTNELHAQAKTVAEPGSEAQYKSTHEFFGEPGRFVYYGLGARVVRGILTVSYQD